MATIANLAVKLNLEDSGFQRGLQNTRDKLDSWGSSLRGVGTKMTAGITAPLAGGSIALIKWASDLEQTHGATEQLWGDNADSILSWAQDADKAMGMTENSALQNANRFNAMFKQMDVGNDVIMDMSKEFTGLSADLSAMWGGSPDEAADRLTSALRGNYEGLDQYNINLTEAMVNTEAMKIAVADGRDEISEADKVQARYNLIVEQSADAQGQFARETNTTAGKLAISTARAKNAATAFGKLLLPYVNKLLDAFSTMVGWIEGLSDTQRKWVIGIAAAAAAIGPLLLVIGMLLPGISALIAVIGFLVTPIGLVVIAVAALAAGFIYAYTQIEWFRDGVNRAVGVVIEYIMTLVDIVTEAGKAIGAVFRGDWSAAWEHLQNAAETTVSAVMQWFTLLPRMILAALNIDATELWSKGWEWIQSVYNGAVGKWNEVTGWLGGLASDAATWIGDTASSIKQKGTDLLQGLWNGAIEKWSAITMWVSLIPSAVLGFIGDLLSTLWQKGVDLVVGLGNGVTAQWVNLKTWFTNLPTFIFNAIGDVLETLNSRGIDILQGFWNGVLNKWVAVSLWFTNLATMIFNAVADTLATLKSRGVDILQGFWDGVLEKWIAVSTWFGSLGIMIVGAVGDLASTLYNAGVAILQGLWDGMKSKWGEITGWLSGLNPADWKGPYRRDIKMLYKPGIWIMQGLGHGLDDGWDDITRQLSNYTPSLTGGLDAARAGIGGQVVNHNYYLTPPEFLKLMQDAEAGGDFARDFASELGMSEGVA